MPQKEYQLVFSFYSHPLFGILIEPYVVQKLENGHLSLTYQKVGEANITDFYPKVSTHERKLLQLLEKLSNLQMARILSVHPNLLEVQLAKISKAIDLKNKSLYEHLRQRLSQAKLAFISNLNGDEMLFEMGKDGNPAFTSIKYEPTGNVVLNYLFEEETFSIQPKFSSNELNGLPIQMLDESTPVVLVGQRLVNLHKNLKPSRLKPFLDKSKNVVQNKFIKEFATKFILYDLQNELAVLNGKVKLEKTDFNAIDIYFNFTFEGAQMGIFESEKTELKLPEKLSVHIRFLYGNWAAKYDDAKTKYFFSNEDVPVFQEIIRDITLEKNLQIQLEGLFDLRLSKGEDKISFVHLRDVIVPNIRNLGPQFQFRFSTEFRQINLKLSKINIKILEKIDFFHIEGSIDWDNHSIDIHDLRNNFEVQNGWLKNKGEYWPIGQEDQAFLNQLFLLSSSSKEITVSKNTAKAIKLENAELFAEKWNYLTTLLVDNQVKTNEDLSQFCPNFTFRSYQQTGFEWLLSLAESDLGGILADDMGLGKTFQAAAFLLYQIRQKKESKPSLIVLPSTLIFNWQYELKRYAPDFKILVHAGQGRKKSLSGVEKNYNVILVSYQTLARDITHLEKEKYGTIIADEAHNLKNSGTISYQAMQKLQGDRIFLLTGTPMQNSPVDLWTLSELCNPGLLSKKIKPQTIQKAENPTKFAEKLNLLQNLVKPFILRRTKENVLKELPTKTISTVLCTMSDEQEIEYLAYNQAIASEISDTSFSPGPGKSLKILKALTKLRQLANHPRLIGLDKNSKSGKFDLVTEKLEEVLSAGHKVLVFSSFVKHLQLFTEYMETNNLKYSLLTGKTKEREKQVEQFRNEPDRNVFFISLKAGGTGLNLVEASYVFLLDPWWNPASEAQAMDRVYRIGQKNAVTVYKFITSNTVEEKIVQLQNQKQNIADQLLTGADMGQNTFTIEMIQEILVAKD